MKVRTSLKGRCWGRTGERRVPTMNILRRIWVSSERAIRRLLIRTSLTRRRGFRSFPMNIAVSVPFLRFRVTMNTYKKNMKSNRCVHNSINYRKVIVTVLFLCSNIF